MKIEEIREESTPETWSEELWELQGRVKALEGFLKNRSKGKYFSGSVDVEEVAAIMGFDIPVTKGE